MPAGQLIHYCCRFELARPGKRTPLLPSQRVTDWGQLIANELQLLGEIAMNVKLICIAVSMSAVLLSEALYASENRQDSVCPKHLDKRTDAEVLQAHVEAFEAGNAALLACDYATDAVFMLPGSVIQGPATFNPLSVAFSPSRVGTSR